MVTQADVHAFLKNANIKKTDTVLVHTSMRAIGKVEGGCDGLIDAFCSYLTDGLFLVPTHTWDSVGKEHPVFDARTEKPCIGALPTVAAFRPDGVRSLHPTHSIAAFGKRAAEFVRGEERATTPCPAGGAWARLCDEDAKILLIGVGLNRNTYIHAVDEMLELPDRLVPPIPLTVIDHEGVRHETLFQKHGHTGSEDFDVFRPPFEACGALTYGSLGNAKVGIFHAKRGTTVLKKLWEAAEYDLCKEPKEIPLSYYPPKDLLDR